MEEMTRYFRKRPSTGTRRTYTKNYRKKAPTARRAVKAASNTRFNTRVLQVVNRSRETKQKVISLESNQPIPGAGLSIPVGSSITTVPGLKIVNLLNSMDLHQGVTQEQRIGNEIDDCHLTIRGVLTSSTYRAQTGTPPYNSSSLPFEVHMLVYKRKKNADGDPLFIKSLPTNAVGPIDQTLINSVYPFNKDGYIIKKHRVFRLRPLVHHTVSSATAGGAEHQLVNSQQSNAPMFARFQCNIPISKKLLYPDGTQIPTNDWCSVAFYVINPDGGDLINTSHTPNLYEERVNLSLDAVLRFKDA